MKPRFLVVLSVAVTIGFGYWLAESSRDDREVWISIGAWILGFWFASSILGVSHARSDSGSGDADEEYDEEYDDEEDDEEEVEGDEDDEED